MSRLVILTVAALVLLAACTSSDDSSSAGDKDPAKPSVTTTTPPTAAPTGPDCAGIWKAGATLPEDYTKCVDNGAYGTQDVTDCDDRTKLVTYADEYFAVTGGRIAKPAIAPLQDTEEFGKAYAACTGE